MSQSVLTVPEVAERLRLNEETVRRWLRTGKIQGVRLGGTRAGYRIPATEVDRLLRGESAAPTADEG